MRVFEMMTSLLLATFTKATSEKEWLEQMLKPPLFDPTTPTSVTAIQGKTAHLHCKVKRLNNKTVSWIRSRDLHILTTGTQTYTNDARFQVARDASRNDWTLMIKFATEDDSGMYECQVSTQPLISYPIHLNVIVPLIEIVNQPEVFIDAGSLLNLTCTVSNSPEPPTFIFWHHDEQTISGESARGGVAVVTKKGNITVSHLLVKNAVATDSGHYSCSPSNGPPAKIRVHVLTGEKPAAMHTSGMLGCGMSWNQQLMLITCIFICISLI